MITYEVNLTIENEIFEDYYNWLVVHAKKMLQYDGFKSAVIAKEKITEDSNQTKITARYDLDSEDSLNNYLTNYATAMRDDGIKRFGNKFIATRRILLEPLTLSEDIQ